MDSERFDTLAKVLALGISRRGAAAGLAALVGISLAQLDEAAAKKKKKKNKKNKNKKKKNNENNSSPPPPGCVPQCAGSNACGADGCGGSCGSCGGGQRCCAGRCQGTWANLTTFGSVGSGPSEFDNPFGVAVSPDEQTVWVADLRNNRISVWTKTGPTTWANQTTFGSGGSEPSQFNDPSGVAVSPDGQTVWVADTINHRIAVWTLVCSPG